MTRGATTGATALVLVCLVASTSSQPARPQTYRPELAVPELLAPFLKDLEPGHDAFPAERQAAEIEARLRELSEALRSDATRRGRIAQWLLAADFRGAPLGPDERAASGAGTFEVTRTPSPSTQRVDASRFAAELRRLTAEMRDVAVAEFLVTAIDASDTSGLVRTDVRYDITGAGTAAWRISHVGTWRMSWRRASSGWQVVEWTTASHATARAKTPVFNEVTSAALGANESFRRQLASGLDAWVAGIDSVLTRDSNGHHGVSVGDADGDGLDDIYVAQPAGLPNRLFRARGDSTFEDVTERSGLGVLDDTAQSLFADIDNDGDQDLVLSTGTAPLLFVNDGKGRFSNVPDAFRFQRPLQGVLTSIAMADYDRDGFLDLYLCVYSYFFGAGEDKAGTPAPYYDARNGPPGVLFRNDGKGRFADVTKETGLDDGNDRYHFAAAWADYDGNGWQDLLVANDFGTKNLYRNLGLQNGKVTFEDVAVRAGVLDHGAGMSAAFLDYDNDGRLDIYTGNMWSATGLRVTTAPTFMPEAPPDVRALYRRHARGNGLFRNKGDGTFEDRSIEARAEMGRWSWASDSLDFDSDGWDDLYVVNGMLTRAPAARASANARASASGGGAPRAQNNDSTPASTPDLEGFFWRQVVAKSPLTRARGTPYDDAWRAINELLVHGSIASRQRNVFLRNDGRGGFDDVSGAVGLDLDADGRSFAVLDIEADGDPDLLVMAARQAPQLRVFRNDFAAAPSSLSIRLVGTKSNRDAVGAIVRVETDRLKRTKVVHAGSGFLSQHSREVLVGLGPSQKIQKLTVEWPSGTTQTFTDVAMRARLRLVEGGALESLERPAPPPAPARTDTANPSIVPAATPNDTWLYEPFPAPEFSAPDVDGKGRSLADLRGRPAVLLFWSTDAAESRAALDALAKGSQALSSAGISVLAVAVDPPERAAQVRAASTRALSTIHATRELGLSYAIVNRRLFMNRQDLQLPTAFLLDASGRIVKVYRRRVDAAAIARDAGAIDVPPAERLSRALPFAGMLYSAPPARNYLPYGRELLDQGLDAAAVAAFERAAQASPSASTLYRLGTLLAKTGEAGRARAAFERALTMQPDLAEANNDLGALIAQAGDLDGAIARFRAALSAEPDYPDALNNLGYALLLTGRDAEARGFYERALALQPDFPEALNNLGLLFGRSGDLDRAERHFRDALIRRPEFGDAANNLALVLVARGQSAAAVTLLQQFLGKVPAFEEAYITLAKIHFKEDRAREGVAALERLLQRNPTHPVALELLKQWKGR